MLNIIDMINDSNTLTQDFVLVSYDIVNMFPSVDNVSFVEAVSEILKNSETIFPPVECIEFSYVWNTATLYLMRNFIYRKMVPLW